MFFSEYLYSCVFCLDERVIVYNSKVSLLASESDGGGILPERKKKEHRYFQIRRPNLLKTAGFRETIQQEVKLNEKLRYHIEWWADDEQLGLMVEAEQVWTADQTALLGGGRPVARGRGPADRQKHKDTTHVHKYKYTSQAKKDRRSIQLKLCQLGVSQSHVSHAGILEEVLQHEAQRWKHVS